MPVGVPVPWPSATPPAGWLKCNGAAFSSEMYPNLAKAYPTNKLPEIYGANLFVAGMHGRGVDAGRGHLKHAGRWLTGSHYHNIRSWDAWITRYWCQMTKKGIVCCRQITPSGKVQLTVDLPVDTERNPQRGMKPAHAILPSIIL
nr:phage tail protein [Escherichia coli]